MTTARKDQSKPIPVQVSQALPITKVNPHNDDDIHSDSVSDFLRFDLSVLQQVATENLGKYCVSIRKIAESSYHKVYLLTMDDGFECIGRVSFPCFRHLKTESEVVTM